MLRDINLLALRLKIFAKKRDLLISLLRDTYLSKERIFTRLYIGCPLHYGIKQDQRTLGKGSCVKWKWVTLRGSG